MTTKQSFFAQFTPDQIRAGYARNAEGLRTMLAKAERTGRKVNGFTADYLRKKAAEYEVLSRASDAVIAAHVARPVPPYSERKAMREATLAVALATTDRPMTNTTHALTVGQTVKYACPEAGEESERFLVLELRGERVLLGMLGFEDWPIPPTCARLASDMEPVNA